ncbi:MAG: MFS transporter, partial [Planctomycetaceae bacterium]|nr:MFS transporter [Planctomycetaceae bacterium]
YASPMSPSATPSGVAGKGKWMALAAALLGWMFDGFEMGLFPLVARPALLDLLGSRGDDKAVGLWFGVMIAGFLVGAATGGVLFGWLGDRIGRVRAMTLSVLAYTLFTGLCGLAPNLEWFFLFRFIASLGMGGEWSLGVSLVMEIWPNTSRGWLAGLIGAAANVGFLLIALISLGLSGILDSLTSAMQASPLPEAWVAALVKNDAWRLLLLIGALPALLTFFIRLFVPESQRWLQEQERGATSHWSSWDLLGVAGGTIGPLLTIYVFAWDKTTLGDVTVEHSYRLRLAGLAIGLAVALVGYLYPVRRYLARVRAASGEKAGTQAVVGRMIIAACLSGVALLGTWASIQSAPSWADHLAKTYPEEAKHILTGNLAHAKAYTQIAMGIGAIIGTIVAAVVGSWFSRRWMYVALCLASLGTALLFWQFNTRYDYTFLASVMLAGGVTAAFYGWIPLYLPELFGTSVRATAQGFGYNFGRILAAVGALQSGYLMNEVFGGDYSRAYSTMSLVYLVGVAIIWLAPETHGKPLPD